MNATRKHPLCKNCQGQIPDHLHNSARYCSKECIYRFQANKDGRTPRKDAVTRFWDSVNIGADTECWVWQAATNRGYGVISVGGRSAGMTGAHRFSYELANGPIPPGGHILHSCDNPPCVNPAHLRLANHDENMRDMASRERVNTTKLTARQVIDIRLAAQDGETQASLASRFGVSKSNIAFIVSRKTWKHV